MHILAACDNSSMLNTILFIKNIMKIIFIVVPIVLALLFSIDLAKNVFAKDDKDNLKLGIKRIIYSVVLMLVPLIVETFMGMISDYSKVAKCYDIATEQKVKELQEKEEDEYEKKKEEARKAKEEQKQKVDEEKKAEEKARKEAEKGANKDKDSPTSPSVSGIADKPQKGNGYIAHATSASRGRRDIKGDQSKKEVLIQKNTLKWTYIGRFKDPLKASKAAYCGEQGAKNNHIGYGVNDYTSLYYAAKAKKWDLSKINKNVNTVCSAFASVCINAAGVSITKDLNGYSPNVIDKLKDTGAFTIMKYDKKKVQRGDILVRYKIHVGIAL